MSYNNATINTLRGNTVTFKCTQAYPEQYSVYLNAKSDDEAMYTDVTIHIEAPGQIMFTCTTRDGRRIEQWVEYDPAAQSA
jgi:hypothetical protein